MSGSTGSPQACREFQGQVFDHLEGALSGAALTGFEAHRSSCAACAAALEGIEANERVLRRAVTPGTPDTIWPRIQAEITGRRVTVRPRNRGWIAAAAAVMIAVLGILLSRPGAGPELEIVEVRGSALNTLGGFIPGFEEPNSGTRVVGVLFTPGERGK